MEKKQRKLSLTQSPPKTISRFYDGYDEHTLLRHLVYITELLGWDLGIPYVNENKDQVHGIIMGTHNFIQELTEQLGEKYVGYDHVTRTKGIQ